MKTPWEPSRAGKPLQFALLAALVLLPVSWCRGLAFITNGEGHSLEQATFRIHLNRARVDELTLIPGIGPRLAQAIVGYRETRGPFRRISDLERVEGLGPVKASVIKQWILHNDRGELPLDHRSDNFR